MVVSCSWRAVVKRAGWTGRMGVDREILVGGRPHSMETFRWAAAADRCRQPAAPLRSWMGMERREHDDDSNRRRARRTTGARHVTRTRRIRSIAAGHPTPSMIRASFQFPRPLAAVASPTLAFPCCFALLLLVLGSVPCAPSSARSRKSKAVGCSSAELDAGSENESSVTVIGDPESGQRSLSTTTTRDHHRNALVYRSTKYPNYSMATTSRTYNILQVYAGRSIISLYPQVERSSCGQFYVSGTATSSSSSPTCRLCTCPGRSYHYQALLAIASNTSQAYKGKTTARRARTR